MSDKPKWDDEDVDALHGAACTYIECERAIAKLKAEIERLKAEEARTLDEMCESRVEYQRLAEIEDAARDVDKYAVPVPGDESLSHVQSRWIAYLHESLAKGGG